MYVNTLASHRHNRFLRDTEGGTGGGGSTEGGAGGTGGTGGTGGSEFDPITSQEEFDKRISRRITQIQGKYADYDTLKEKATAFDQLEAESRTEHERALAEATEKAEQTAAGKFIPAMVKTKFEAMAVGKLTEAQVAALLDDLDLHKYAANGEPDSDKIRKKIDAVAGSKSNGSGPDLGQGSGRGGTGPKKGESGEAEAKRRYGERAQALGAGR